MTWEPEETARKLAQIAALTAGELVGWHRYCTGWREPFPGELAALMKRAAVLGLTLQLPAARNGLTTVPDLLPHNMNTSTRHLRGA